MSLKNAIGGIALIAGTAIGAAVLALPIVTAHLGLAYTLCVYTLCWFFMTIGGLYLLEVNLFVGYGSNLISMAEKTLGKTGKVFTWITYLVLLYALIAAYLTGMGTWVQQGLGYFDLALSPFKSALCATFLTLVVIFLGTAVTDWVNRFLMLGLIGTFGTLLFATAEHVQPALLMAQPFLFDLRPIPITITAFGSAIVIPSLTEYLHGKPRQLFYVVLIGSLIPLCVYILWEIAIVGVIPFSGPHSLQAIQQHGHPMTDIPAALQMLLNSRWITKASTYFSVFALITSLLGVSLALFDFLADGLHLRKSFKHKLGLAVITFLPPLVFTLYYPKGFIFALSFAGFFVAILLGILPALMAWHGRYRLKAERPLQMIGGKPLIVLTLLFFTGILLIECFNQYEAFFR